MFLLSQTERWVCCTQLPSEKKEIGKRGKSMTFTVEVSESTSKDGGENNVVAVQSGLAQSR